MKALCRLGAVMALSLAAAATAAAPAMPASWEGVYGIVGGPPGLPGETPLDALPAGIRPLNPDHGAQATARLLPWARAKMEASAQYSVVDDTGAVCSPVGFFRHPTTVAGWMLLQSPGVVLLVSTDLEQVGVRRIFLTDRHPDNLPPTWNGHSIGHWDGDTLVVDTIGFNDQSWLGSELQPHTEALHVVERIRLVGNDRFLEIHTTVDDRKALSGPYSYSRYYARNPGTFEQLTESCNEAEGEQATWHYMRQQAVEQQTRARGARP